MSMISRRALYAAGEPLGEGATRRDCGRTRYGCGGGDSSSSSSSTSETNNVDRRFVVGNNAVGISADNSEIGTVTIQSVDANIVNRAMDSVTDGQLINAKSFEHILASQAMENQARREAEAAALQAQLAASSAAFSTAAATVSAAGAQTQAGFSQLINAGLNLFEDSTSLVNNVLGAAMKETSRTQDLTAAAYQTAVAEKAGAIDNKTITILGISAAVAAVAISMRKR